jgi:hypothetical protein
MQVFSELSFDFFFIILNIINIQIYHSIVDDIEFFSQTNLTIHALH